MSNLAPGLVRTFRRAGRRAPLKSQSSLLEIFHENTKLSPLSGRAYGRHIAAFLSSPVTKQIIAEPYKVYSLTDQMELGMPRVESELERWIVARRSARRFTGEAITVEQLSRLLFFSYGRTNPARHFRAVASGGALYPLEVYAVVRTVAGLEPWVYHYDIEHHRLDVVRREDRWEDLKRCVGLQDMDDPDSCSLILFLTAVFERSSLKYLDRSYRLILMEAGEVAQNLALLATSLGLGGYFLGGFIDDALSDLLEIDGIYEAPLLPMVLGVPAEPNAGAAPERP